MQHVAAAKQIEMSEPSLPPVYADRDRVDQVVDNLIGNAVRFAPEGGRIRVAAEQAVSTSGRTI